MTYTNMKLDEALGTGRGVGYIRNPSPQLMSLHFGLSKPIQYSSPLGPHIVPAGMGRTRVPLEYGSSLGPRVVPMGLGAARPTFEYGSSLGPRVVPTIRPGMGANGEPVAVAVVEPGLEPPEVNPGAQAAGIAGIIALGLGVVAVVLVVGLGVNAGIGAGAAALTSSKSQRKKAAKWGALAGIGAGIAAAPITFAVGQHSAPLSALLHLGAIAGAGVLVGKKYEDEVVIPRLAS
jgi:hypothetical protein